MTNFPVTYLSNRSDEAHELFVYFACPTCGRPLIEEVVAGGTMFRCRYIGEVGEQPEQDAPKAVTHWWCVFNET